MNNRNAIDINAHPYFFEDICDEEQEAFVQKVTGLMHNSAVSMDLVFRKQNAAGIDKSVISPLDLTTKYGRSLSTNEETKLICDRYPDRFIGFASADPKDALAEKKLEKAFAELDLKGLYLDPSVQEFYPDDENADKLYKLCVKYDRPVLIECGCSAFPRVLSKYAQPMAIEEIAYKYPELRICMSRFAWPWTQEACMILLKYRNVYTDTAIVYFDDSERMYEQLMTVDMGPKWIDRSFRHQVMYGSSDPGLEQVRQCNALRKLPFRESTINYMLRENALQFIYNEGDMRWKDD